MSERREAETKADGSSEADSERVKGEGGGLGNSVTTVTSQAVHVSVIYLAIHCEIFNLMSKTGTFQQLTLITDDFQPQLTNVTCVFLYFL